MKKIFLLLVLIAISTTENFAQIYSRPSFTPIFLNFRSGANYSGAAESIVLPDKYDYNFFGSNTLDINAEMVSPSAKELESQQARLSTLLSTKGSSLEQIKQLRSQIKQTQKQLDIEDSIRAAKIKQAIYNDGRLANKIISSILIDESTKAMSLEVLSKRAEYNASDADYIKAMNSESKMSAIRDKGQDLLKNVYFIVFDTKSISETQANKNDSRLKYLNYSGSATLYQIDIDTLMKTGQFDNLVFVQPDPVKYAQFQNFNFPIKEITKKSFNASASNYNTTMKNLQLTYEMKSEEEINKEVVADMFNNVEPKFVKEHKPLKTKVTVFSTGPITAKIGKKESLRIDDIYRVVENKQRNNQKIVERHIGWVRAQKVSDNKANANGKTQPSVFYKVGSKKVEKGMKLIQKPEKGIIIGTGFAVGDNNIMAGPYFTLDYITHASPGLRAGITLGVGQDIITNQVTVGSSRANWRFKGTSTYLDMTAQKIIQKNRIEITPLLGAYFGMADLAKVSFSNTGNNWQEIKKAFTGVDANESWTYTEIGAVTGFKFGFNFGRHTQLNFGFKSGMGFSKSLQDQNQKDIQLTGGTLEVKYKTPSVGFIGLRLFGF
jgi:hypothetical protein